MAEQPPLHGTTIEERHDYMISPTGGSPTFRKAYFLRPMVTSTEGPSLKLPSLTRKPKWPLKVAFNGWRYPLRKWKSWVAAMHPRYSRIWKDAGIYDAVMGSIYKIQRDEDLMFGIAERWCSETNTFFFPWGEATITLEDMLILGGISVLGYPISLPLERKELVEIEEFLEERRRRFKICSHAQWLNLFMHSRSKFEHEAFLSLWLSRFVFPGNRLNDIDKHVFLIAIHLARGMRLALGPAVLASIYRDLGLLREAMAESTKLMSSEDDSFLFLTLWSPLSLVQAWAWERLPSLQPKPNTISSFGVRLARWDGQKNSEIGNVRPAIDSAGVTFLWRPYTLNVDNLSFPSFYKEKEEFHKGADMSVELESFVRCLRACHLVGIDCQEPYNPHRVAMQFGFDQDLPAWIPRQNTSLEIAWHNYSESLSDDELLYLPPRLYESDVTTGYLEWWRKTVLCPLNATTGLMKGGRSPRKAPLKHPRDIKHVMILSNDPDVPSDFPSKRLRKRKYKPSAAPISQSCSKFHARSHSPSVAVGSYPGSQPVMKTTRHEYLQKLVLLKTENDPEVPPGFPPRTINGIKMTNDSSMVIQEPCSEIRYEETSPSCVDMVSYAAHSQCHLSLVVGVGSLINKKQLVDKNIIQNEVVDVMSEGRCNNSSNCLAAAVSDLEARVTRLETRLLTALKNTLMQE